MRKTGRKPVPWKPHEAEALATCLAAGMPIGEIAKALGIGRMRIWNKIRQEQYSQVRPPKKIYPMRHMNILTLAPPLAGRPMEDDDLIEADEKWAALFGAPTTSSYTSISTTSLYQYQEVLRERFV